MKPSPVMTRIYFIDCKDGGVLYFAFFYLTGGFRVGDGCLDEAVEGLKCLEVLHLRGDAGIK